MIRLFQSTSLTFSLMVFLAVGSYAQEIQPVSVDPGTARMACTGEMNAGTVGPISPLQAQSNSASSQADPIFLCFNDIIFINHNGDYDFTGDPDASTQPGIGYQFYRGPPSVSGDEASDLLGDPNLLLISDIPFSSWVAKGLPNGDVYFQNEGQVQDQFFGGNPGQIWFAPITLSDFDGGFISEDCVNVGVNEAFSIVYLNAISLASFQTDPGALSGTMSIVGGLPEWDPSRSYTITMVNTDDPFLRGRVNEVATHNGVVTFDVPAEGNYEITITDGMGCSYTVIRRVPADATPVRLCLPTVTVNAGDQFCVPITVGDYIDVVSYAYAIVWDPTMIAYERFDNVHPSIAQGASWNPTEAFSQGIFSTLWFDLTSAAQTLSDDEVLFELCFTAVGDPGDRTTLNFSPTPTSDISITNETDELPFETKNGLITIEPPRTVGIFRQNICLSNLGITISFSAFGGTAPYTYELVDVDLNMVIVDGLIDAPGSTVTIGPGGVPLASLQLFVRDASIPPNQSSITIDATSLNVIEFDLVSADPVCPESSDGFIRIENLLSNGDPTYEWENLETGEKRFGVDSIGGLDMGIWEAQVTDANGCFSTVVDTVTTDTISISFSVLGQPGCEGSGSGMINATAENEGSFEYRWYDQDNRQIGNAAVSDQGSSIRDLEPGTYFVEVRDANGLCPAKRDSVTLFAERALSVVVDPSTTEQVDCSGDLNGRIQIRAEADMNDSQDYTFSWSDLGNGTSSETNNTSTVSNLGPGTYLVTITDNQSGCEVDSMFVIDEPDPLEATAMVIQPECPDGSNGSIDFGFFNNVGGTPFPPDTWPPYEVLWNGIQVDNRSATDDVLGAGEYPVILIDANGCSDTTVFVLSSGPTIEIDGSLADLTCIGDETAALMVTGDVAGNTIEWNTGQTDNTIANLGAGIYIVTVTETMGNEVCPSSDTFEILDPMFDVTITQPMRFDALTGCREDPNGRIFNMDINIGGPKDWNFVGPGDLDTTFRASLPFLEIDTSGTYYYSVINSDECIVYRDSIVAQFPEPIEVEENALGPSCYRAGDGEITLDLTRPSTGSTQFSINWSTGFSEQDVSSSTINMLDSGTYVFEVFDVLDPDCSFIDSILIDDPDPLELAVDTMASRLSLCFGERDGRIEVTRSGGNSNAAPIWTWSHDQTIQGRVAEDLVANTYTITIEDDRGCTDMLNVELQQLEELSLVFTEPAEPQCFGALTTVNVTDASGGLPEYSFSVDNGPTQTLGTEIPILAGEHIITVFDAANCSHSDTINVLQPDELTIDLSDEIVVGLGDSVQIRPNFGGLSELDVITWTPPEFLSCADCVDPLVSPEDDQLFRLSVIDVNGCTAEGEVMVRVDKARSIFIPNTFSPNNDGINDLWQVFAGPSVRNIVSTRIVDRWGNVVFFNDTPEPGSSIGSTGWDGMANGQALDPAVYIYLVEVEFVDNRTFLFRGDITLIR